MTQQLSSGAQLIAPLMSALFHKDIKRWEKKLQQLIEENHAMGGSPHGYLYFGKFWTLLPPNQQKKTPKQFLHVSLHEQGKEIYDEKALMDKEQIHLRHGLQIVLRDCHTHQDIKDALPDTAALIVPELGKISRTRKEGWPIRGNPLHEHDFQKIVEIFSFYAANQLLH